MLSNRKWLVYVSFTKQGKEVLLDYTLTAPSRVEAKKRAMNRMIVAGGENRCIDGCHEFTKKFKENEASMISDGGRDRVENND